MSDISKEKVLTPISDPPKERGSMRRTFPYQRVARLWSQGKTISQIAQRTGYVDEGRADGDRYHTMRVWLGKMHKGYRDRDGRLVKLPYRASRAVVREAKARRVN